MKKLVFTLVSLTLTILFYLSWWNSPLLQQIDYKIYDRFSAMFPSSHIPSSTVIVDIDDESLKEFGQWPWPRVITAQLLNSISEAKPSAIVMDIVFSEKDRTSPNTLVDFYQKYFNTTLGVEGLSQSMMDNDLLLSKAIGDGTTILPVFANIGDQSTPCLFPPSTISASSVSINHFYDIDSLVCSLPLFQKSARGLGHIHARADSDGTFRRLSLFIRYHDTLLPTLGIAGIALNGPIKIASTPKYKGDIRISVRDKMILADSHSNVLLSFYPIHHHERVSASRVLHGTIDPKYLKGKYIFVGTTALGLDTWHTLNNGAILPGVFVHATVVENILNGELIVQPSLYPLLNLGLSFVTAILLLILMQRKRYISVLFTFATLLLISVWFGYIGWKHHIYLSLGYFIIPLISYLFILALFMFLIDYLNTKRYLAAIYRAAEQKKRLSNELARSESEVEYQKAMLFQQSKLAAMGEMIDNIAHQWRQPLNLLGMIIQQMPFDFQKKKIDENYVHKLSDDSMEQILFMSQTIDDFRNFLRPDRKISPFDLSLAIHESLHLLSGMFKAKNITVEFNDCDEIVTVIGSASEFKQVIINLLHNARDALIETKVSNPKILISLSKNTPMAVLMFQDNGGGIDPKIISQIFEANFTTKEKDKGTGIGLYIVEAIVRNKMGGVIECTNVEDGALFTIKLPLCRD
ncbi:CHASE2 and HATPase_c domain-containing protein [Sulfuricurvum sp.]|uniref:CHASE2 and HATPase_c domain-containing protein n=1 Tax=Sulfuricurvum sp. TaxID=2025608 RepID=UPI00262C5AEF|nr:CHASE2 and HATPase_c domain-containing protein [Sulfuricurvum sp.]MDD2780539.1 CHASE2 and HATPase_c domain-containing protein [Sulfuricurvum sp.]